MIRNAFMLCGFVMLLLALPSHAYIGPGVGVSLIGWVVGAGVVTGTALWAVISLPLRMFFKKRKSAGRPHRDTPGNESSKSVSK